MKEGVFQMSNGNQGYRFVITNKGERIDRKRVCDENGKPFRTEKQALSARAKVFDMYRGEESMVTLRASNIIADAVVDVCGHSILMVPFDKESFTATVLVEVSPTFFAWLTNFGNKIEITNPPQVREQFKEHIKEIAALY